MATYVRAPPCQQGGLGLRCGRTARVPVARAGTEPVVHPQLRHAETPPHESVTCLPGGRAGAAGLAAAVNAAGAAAVAVVGGAAAAGPHRGDDAAARGVEPPAQVQTGKAMRQHAAGSKGGRRSAAGCRSRAPLRAPLHSAAAGPSPRRMRRRQSSRGAPCLPRVSVRRWLGSGGCLRLVPLTQGRLQGSRAAQQCWARRPEGSDRDHDKGDNLSTPAVSVLQRAAPVRRRVSPVSC